MSGLLKGKRILVTRPEARAASLIAKVTSLGARAICLPAIRFEPVADSSELDTALREAGTYDVIVFTSVTGVEAVSARMIELRLSTDAIRGRKLAVIGPATAAAVEKWLRKPDTMPNEYVAEAIADALGGVAGMRILLLRADLARRDLHEILSAKGAAVEEVSAYRIVAASVETFDWSMPAPDIITFTSAASARFVAETLTSNGRTDWLGSGAIVCIGPITRDAVLEMGFKVTATAAEYTEAGLVKAMMGLEFAHA